MKTYYKAAIVSLMLALVIILSAVISSSNTFASDTAQSTDPGYIITWKGECPSWPRGYFQIKDMGSTLVVFCYEMRGEAK